MTIQQRISSFAAILMSIFIIFIVHTYLNGIAVAYSNDQVQKSPVVHTAVAEIRECELTQGLGADTLERQYKTTIFVEGQKLVYYSRTAYEMFQGKTEAVLEYRENTSYTGYTYNGLRIPRDRLS